MKTTIVGWGTIIPQLAAFFSVLKRRPNHLTPFNLFVSGLPGSNKTEGLEELVQALGLSVAMVDAATLDDVSELAGVADLQANRERGENAIIRGDLLDAQVLILDEVLNTRLHVLPQMRLFLQGLLVLMAKKVELKTQAIISCANLQEDLQAGEANRLDSPTADRYAMVVRVPSIWEMELDEQEAILEGRPNGHFGRDFQSAVAGIEQEYQLVEQELGAHITRYVRSLGRQLSSTPFAFEGRRGKLLRQFIVAVVALCRAEPDRDVSETVWVVVRDCLTYHKLSGLDIEEDVLQAAHAAAIEVLLKVSTTEALIAEEPDLGNKVGLIVRHLNQVSAISKADVFGKIIEAGELPLQLACMELVRSNVLADEPAELRAMVVRIQLPFPQTGVPLNPAALTALSQMSQIEAQCWELCEGDQREADALLAQVREYLTNWGVS